MKNTDIQKIRQSAEIAKGIIEKAIEWAKDPQSVDLYCNNALDSLDRILALLPCPTCNGTGKSLKYTKVCPECGCSRYVNENLLGEGSRVCRECGQDWWLNVKYGIGEDPCPNCQQPKIR